VVIADGLLTRSKDPSLPEQLNNSATQVRHGTRNWLNVQSGISGTCTVWRSVKLHQARGRIAIKLMGFALENWDKRKNKQQCLRTFSEIT